MDWRANVVSLTNNPYMSSKKNTITLKPTGGLCNRLLAIDSALSLSKDLSSNLHIHWVQNHYLNASFFELFKPLNVSQVTFTETNKKLLLFSDRELYKPKQRLYNFVLKRYQGLYFDKVLHGNDVKKLAQDQYDFRNFERYESILITSWTRFVSKKIDVSHFQPIEPIQSSINKLTSAFNQHTIGIHIRRSDHELAIRKSPTSLFIEIMNRAIEKNTDTNFFLASDSEEEKKTLQRTFGDRIILHTVEAGDRNSKTGMQAAVVDLFCLSKTSKIFGSFYSTFSLVASEIGNIPFEEVTSETSAK